MSAGPIGREGKGTPRRGVPAENEAVPGGGASERREETEPEKEGSKRSQGSQGLSREKRTEPGRVEPGGWWFVVEGLLRAGRVESASSTRGSREKEPFECEGAGSFDVVSELALSAACPCVPRGHVPPGYEVPTEPREVSFSFFSFGFLCVGVCEASSAK